ncbi:hypothetical protein H6G80_12040 [Nostoc sp. FACHB-87]|uniref:hypothetical protein n=1 Tax=Nostocales TaxID=1161 RepID=UPI001688C846|nr:MULTISPECIES: hypothetical protein [Nostocales]MBD2454811.1 hypothetical protein [Nostoc sp. FACHB-87]MBD2476731.1 hypothetical protein [Anabaena sp. FACHB-83]MBD2487520.1 hypothetical protein [Aulosira sp. FACHB-615]
MPSAFAARIPTIVVMVDELAGDGAGAPFVRNTKLKNDCDRWMTQKLTDQPLPNPKSKI